MEDVKRDIICIKQVQKSFHQMKSDVGMHNAKKS